MKFTSSFQCLMGGNAVQQLHESSSLSSVVLPAATKSSIMLLDDKMDSSSSSSSRVAKKKLKTKKKKKKKKKMDDQKVIKVFKPDGEINLYNKRIRVSEVMTDDQYMVCRSDSFYIGQKIPSLSQDDRLERASKLQDIDHMHDNMKMKAAFLKKAAASSCSPFDIQKTPSGTLRIRVSEQFISQLMMDQAVVASSNDHLLQAADRELIDQAADILCTTPQLHREYKQLVVGSRRGWKPKLEVIKETPPKGKRKVKLLLSASISRMKKKMKNNKIVGGGGVPHISSSSSPASKKNKKTIIKPAAAASSSSVKSNKFSKITRSS